MSYWQKIGKHFSIKVALPHLFLGVVAAALSLSSQASLPANIPTTNIITIASVIVNLHETAAETEARTEYLPSTTKIDLTLVELPFLSYIVPVKPVRLTPDNGIRAGPTSLPII